MSMFNSYPSLKEVAEKTGQVGSIVVSVSAAALMVSMLAGVGIEVFKDIKKAFSAPAKTKKSPAAATS